jgi:hypothetical protein
LLLLAILSIVGAWCAAVRNYYESVATHRIAWGRDGKEPRFRITSLIVPDPGALNVIEFYIIAAALGVPGLLGLWLTRGHKK